MEFSYFCCAAVQRYFNTTQFDYTDAGINLTGRSWVIFQVMTTSDFSIGLSSWQFTGAPTSPDYELQFDLTVLSSYWPGHAYVHSSAR